MSEAEELPNTGTRFQRLGLPTPSESGGPVLACVCGWGEGTLTCIRVCLWAVERGWMWPEVSGTRDGQTLETCADTHRHRRRKADRRRGGSTQASGALPAGYGLTYVEAEVREEGVKAGREVRSRGGEGAAHARLGCVFA